MNLAGEIILASTMLLPISAIADCPGDIPTHLEWCSRNNDFNEGATCGAQALAGLNVGVPAIVAQPVLGNLWSRTNMMGATVAAYKAGYQDQAVAAATCCQVHNGGAFVCLQSRPDLVNAWLSTR